jgi:hypothetical protein
LRKLVDIGLLAPTSGAVYELPYTAVDVNWLIRGLGAAVTWCTGTQRKWFFSVALLTPHGGCDMKKLFAVLALATLVASPALAAPWYNPSYDCGPAQYDSSGAPVAKYCE